MKIEVGDRLVEINQRIKDYTFIGYIIHIDTNIINVKRYLTLEPDNSETYEYGVINQSVYTFTSEKTLWETYDRAKWVQSKRNERLNKILKDG
jgi:hypothetical protein